MLMWSWHDRDLDQLAMLARDVERSNRMETTRDLTTDEITRLVNHIPPIVNRAPATIDRVEPIAPRTRVNVKQLANGKWQPDITVESFDADPLTEGGRDRIRDRLALLMVEVDLLIEGWESDGG